MEGRKRLGFALMFLAAVVLCAAAGFGIGRLQLPGQGVKAAAAVQDSSHRGVPVQGVKIHGWWTIKVFDHGRLVQNRQFENSLLTVNQVGNGGDTVLASLLSRQYSMGPWQLYANDSGGGQLFQLSSSADIGLQGVNGPLTVSGATPGHVILSGNYTAGSSISIGKVATSVSLCVAATAPASCVNYFNDFFFNFTSATLGSPVAVASGQIVQVKVDISFS